MLLVRVNDSGTGLIASNMEKIRFGKGTRAIPGEDRI